MTKSKLGKPGIRLTCMECGKKFKRIMATYNHKCPKCGSHDLEVG